MINIYENIILLRQKVNHTAALVDRNANTINIVAASKGQSVARIREAYAGGLRNFGENYLQEAQIKMDQLLDLAISWHFIGPVQSNKTAILAQRFDWIHSVDRFRIAERLSRQRPDHLPPLQICLQVNIDSETSKSGLMPELAAELAEAVCELPRLKLRGLMAIPRPRAKVEEQAQPFHALAELLADIKFRSPKLAALDTLSMGMSNDLVAAVKEGATMVRVGTAIFGPRETSPHKLSPHR